MPEILERLYGIKFFMYYFDNDVHNRPHIHVHFGGYKASVAIDKIEVLAGALPAKKLKLAEEYIKDHQQLLLIQWQEAVIGRAIQRIH